jgi:hypothetical protein
MKYILTALLLAAASPLMAQSSWLHSVLDAGVVNREISPTEYWVEVAVMNQSQSSEMVNWAAYRYNGVAMQNGTFTLASGEKHVFKIDAPGTEVLSADERELDERLHFTLVMYASTGNISTRVRQLTLHGNRLKTAEFGAMPRAEHQDITLVDFARDSWITLSNLTDQSRTALICRARLRRCVTNPIVVAVPGFGTKVIGKPDTSPALVDYTQLIVNSGAGMVSIGYDNRASSSSSTFEVNSGVTFGQPVK